LELPREERAFVYGSVMVKAKAEEKLIDEMD